MSNSRFDAVKHEYYIDDRKLMSVTELIGTYERPFNANMVSHMVAKKNGRDKNDILNEWQIKKDIAIAYGNSIHLAIEMWIKFKIKPTQKHLEEALDSFLEKYGDEYESEKRVFNYEYELGGTMDLINDIYIDDIKTNRTNKKATKGNFIKPLNKIKVNNLNKARLQLSIYDKLTGSSRKLRILNFDGYSWETIELEKVDVDDILEIRKQELEKERLVEEMF